MTVAVLATHVIVVPNGGGVYIQPIIFDTRRYLYLMNSGPIAFIDSARKV
jgi:hypothetical protein